MMVMGPGMMAGVTSAVASIDPITAGLLRSFKRNDGSLAVSGCCDDWLVVLVVVRPNGWKGPRALRHRIARIEGLFSRPLKGLFLCPIESSNPCPLLQSFKS
jgi:hypothetical protein